MASRAAYREEVEEGAILQFRREQLWKRAFDRLRFYGQWSRYEKRIKRIQEKKMRKFWLVRMFNGWRDQTYQTKREKLTIAHVKRCELEKDQLLRSKKKTKNNL